MNKFELEKLKRLNTLTGKSNKELEKIISIFETYDSVYDVLIQEIIKAMEKDFVGVMKKYLYHYCKEITSLREICTNIDLFLNKIGFKIDATNGIELIGSDKKLHTLLEEYVTNNLENIKSMHLYSENDSFSILILSYCDSNNIDIKNGSLNKKQLSIEEERNLLIKAKSGNIEARDKLIMANIGLSKHVASWYLNRGMDFEDLVSEGVIGIIKAIEDFDLEKNVKFSTYAVPKIRATIRRNIDKKARIIRKPLGRNDVINKINITKEKLTHTLGRFPTNKELADNMGISIEILEKVLHDGTDVISLETEITTDSKHESTLEDTLEQHTFEEPEDFYVSVEMKSKVEQLLETSNLTDREKEIIRYRFGFNGDIMSLREMTKVINVSAQRIGKSEKLALKKLRKNPKTIGCADYLGDRDRVLKSLENMKKIN